jgi:hypothetical protein
LIKLEGQNDANGSRDRDQLGFLRAPINTLQQFLQQLDNIGSNTVRQDTPGPFGGAALLAVLFAGTRSFASGLFTTVLFLYFLLASGDTFLRRLVEVLPSFSSKRQAVDISQQIESDISVYLLTITVMNAMVGLATAAVMWLTEVGDPVLCTPTARPACCRLDTSTPSSPCGPSLQNEASIYGLLLLADWAARLGWRQHVSRWALVKRRYFPTLLQLRPALLYCHAVIERALNTSCARNANVRRASSWIRTGSLAPQKKPKAR